MFFKLLPAKQFFSSFMLSPLSGICKRFTDTLPSKAFSITHFISLLSCTVERPVSMTFLSAALFPFTCPSDSTVYTTSGSSSEAMLLKFAYPVDVLWSIKCALFFSIKSFKRASFTITSQFCPLSVTSPHISVWPSSNSGICSIESVSNFNTDTLLFPSRSTFVTFSGTDNSRIFAGMA